MADIGYARVSTSEQNLDLQIAALKKAGVEKIFTDDGISGTLASRPGLDEARAYLREGDRLTVWKLDRLGRSTRNVLALIDELEAEGIGFQSLTESIDTRGAWGKAMMTVMSAFAQLERDLIAERTRAGLAVAKAQGRVGGRPRALNNKSAEFAQDMYDSGKYTAKEIAAELKVSVATVYRYLAQSKSAESESSSQSTPVI